MNVLSAPVTSTYAPQKAAGAWQKSSALPSSGARDLVSLSDAGKSAVRQDMLADRVSSLQSGALDMAQNLLGNVAQQIFGDAGKGAKFSFDSASVSAQSSFAMAAQSSSGPGGSSSAVGMRLDDTASFSGQGTITTADGRSFSFQIEVSYESSVQATAATSNSTPVGGTAGAKAPTGSVPADSAPAEDKPAQDLTVNFPGTVGDLLRLFSQNMLNTAFDVPATASQDGKTNNDSAQAKQGKLTMRLLDMLEQPDARNPQEKKLSKAYSDATPAKIVDQTS